MPVPDFAHGIQISFLDSATRARTQAHAQVAAAGSGAPSTAIAANGPAADAPLSFDDLLDVVNPLQHLPIVSTLYRHYTHDEIKPLPKIAGDALYGGWMGFVSSVADYAFEKITGKDFGDTVLAMITGDEASAPNTAIPSAAPTGKPAVAVAAAPIKPTAPMAVTTSGPAIPASSVPTKVAAADRPPRALSGASQPIPTIDAATLDAFMTAMSSKGLPGDLSRRTIEAYRRTMAPQGQQVPASSTVH